MKFTAQLDVDVVALESDDEITCLLTLEAPPAPQVADTPGENLIVVVDRSGSMTGLLGARRGRSTTRSSEILELARPRGSK